MKGHIRKRGSTYSIVVDIGKNPETGKRQQKWFSGYKTKKEAQTDLAKIVTELEENTFIIPSTSTMKEYLDYWIEQRESNLSPTTLYSYKLMIKTHIVPELGNVELRKLKPLMINEYYNKKLKNLSGQTVLHHHRLLRKALQDAKSWQLIKDNPADSVEAPKAKKYKATVLNLDEIKELLKALEGNWLEVPISLSLFLGLRRGELLALRWSDVDFENKYISIQRSLVRGGSTGNELIIKDPKTEDSTRDIPITDTIINLLKKHKLKQSEDKLKLGKYYKKSDYIFTRDDGELINPASFSSRFAEFIKENNLKVIRLHDLRHTNATLMLQSNVQPKVASKRLGHSTTATTLEIYSHVLKDMERDTSDSLDSMIFDTR